MKIAKFIVIAALGMALSSCLPFKCQEIYPEDAIPSYKLDGITGEMAKELCGSFCAAPRSILVTDFVPFGGAVIEKNGVFIGHVMRAAVAKQCCAEVSRTDFSGKFEFASDGTVIVGDKVKAEKSPVIVSSYLATQDKLILISNLVDPATGAVLRSARREGATQCVVGKRSLWFVDKPKVGAQTDGS